MFPIILVFILRESVDRSDNPTSRWNVNSRSVCYSLSAQGQQTVANLWHGGQCWIVGFSPYMTLVVY